MIHSFTTPCINTGQHMKHLLRSAVMVLNNSTSLESGSAKKTLLGKEYVFFSTIQEGKKGIKKG